MSERDTLTPADEKRITKQRDAVLKLMLSGNWLTLSELSQLLEREYGRKFPEASVSARLRDLRKRRYGSYRVDHRRREGGSGWWEYRLAEREAAKKQLELMP
jgi:hypothetical protein